MKYGLLFLFSGLLAMGITYGQGWERIEDFPTRALAVPSFVINDTPYLLTYDEQRRDVLYRLNVETHSWDSMSTIPLGEGEGRQGGVGFALQGKGYILGGARALDAVVNDVWCYDPRSNTWDRKGDFPLDLFVHYEDMNAFVIGDSAYVIEGLLDQLYMYNVETDEWMLKSNYPSPGALHMTSFSIGDKGYVGLGFNSREESNATIYAYDPRNDRWEKETDFPGGSRNGAVAFVLGDKAYVGMGNGVGEVYNDFYAYDPETKQWEDAADCGYRASNVAAFSVGSCGYVGTGVEFVDVKSEFWKYLPATTSNETRSTHQNRLRVFPNPTGDRVYLSLGDTNYDFSGKILDTQGREMMSVNGRFGKSLDVSMLMSGTYFVKIYVKQDFFVSSFRKL